MSNDKRTVSTDALETLGTIIDNNEKRDAIHLAVIPVEAKQKLMPGQDVGIGGTGDNPVGIVDPFLKFPVFPGQYFWLVIYPRKISSLRHVWSHPDIPDDEIPDDANVNDEVKLVTKEVVDKAISIKWIEDYASTVGKGYSYDELMEYAEDFIQSTRKGKYPEYLTGSDEMQDEYTSEEFWVHYQVVTGESLSVYEKQYNFFNCSC